MGSGASSDEEKDGYISCSCREAQRELAFARSVMKNEWLIVPDGYVSLFLYENYHTIIGEEVCHQLWDLCEDYRSLLFLLLIQRRGIKVDDRCKFLYNDGGVAIRQGENCWKLLINNKYSEERLLAVSRKGLPIPLHMME